MDANEMSVAEMVARALEVSGTDEDARFEIVSALHARGDQEVFAVARQLCAGQGTAERVLGADVLGQLGTPDYPFREETMPILIGLCDQDLDVDVLDSAVVAFGHLRDVRGLDSVLRFVDHSSADLRQSVAFALPSVIGEGSAGDPRGISALIALMQDEDDDVRNWATFGLGSQVDVDTPAVRDALASRLDDPNCDAAGEALSGLARRRDPRAEQAVRNRLVGADADYFVLEAAAEIGDPSLWDALCALRDSGWAESSSEKQQLQDALDRCAPR